MEFRSFRPVDVEFFTNAPHILTSTAVIAAPQNQVFEALAGDPSTWTWFPGFSDQGRWLTSPPQGAGSRREVRNGGVRYRETILVWEEPVRWGFRIDEATVPIARALAEEYRLVADGDRTVVHWALCADVRAPLSVAFGLPLARPVLGMLWRRACANLESRLKASQP